MIVCALYINTHYLVSTHKTFNLFTCHKPIYFLHVAIANKRHLQNHQLLMILLKLASSAAAKRECMSALRFPPRPQGGSGFYLAPISDLAIRHPGLISLGALSGGSNQNSLAESLR